MQNMNETTKVSLIGFDGKEAKVLATLLKLCEQKIKGINYVPANACLQANLLFVNEENSLAVEKIQQWGDRLAATKIWVGDNSEQHEYSVRKPLVLKRLSNIIEKAMKISEPEDVPAEHVNARVLVVDDSYSVRQFMQQKIQEICADRVEVVFADSGKVAAQKLNQSHFNLVFLDVIMPGVDGYKVCKWIKSNFNQTKVVMLTSKKSPIDKVRANFSGSDGFISKPPDEAKLKQVLVPLLHLETNEPS